MLLLASRPRRHANLSLTEGSPDKGLRYRWRSQGAARWPWNL